MGPAGSDGAKGATGNTGATGATGPAGPKGDSAVFTISSADLTPGSSTLATNSLYFVYE